MVTPVSATRRTSRSISSVSVALSPRLVTWPGSIALEEANDQESPVFGVGLASSEMVVAVVAQPARICSQQLRQQHR